MTEAQVKAIIANENQRLKEEQAARIDNEPDAYAAEAVAKAAELGILRGNDRGNLMLRSPVTRQDVLVMMDRAGVLGGNNNA
jgi:hypothetical protein